MCKVCATPNWKSRQACYWCARNPQPRVANASVTPPKKQPTQVTLASYPPLGRDKEGWQVAGSKKLRKKKKKGARLTTPNGKCASVVFGTADHSLRQPLIILPENNLA